MTIIMLKSNGIAKNGVKWSCFEFSSITVFGYC